MIRAILLVGVGGGLGSILRYLTAIFSNKYFNLVFPIGTFITNILGCLIIGILMGLLNKHSSSINTDLKLFFITGFCGGYTTFSTFALENVLLINSSNPYVALSYIISSVIIGITAVSIGFYIVS